MIDLFPIESCAVRFVEVVSSNLWGAVGHGGDVEQRLAGLGCAGSEASTGGRSKRMERYASWGFTKILASIFLNYACPNN